MSGYPEDVMQIANAWTAGWQENGGHSDLHMEAIRATIARAILAERDRCARIAEAEDFLPKHVMNSPECMVARDIAAAIRNGKEAP